MTEMFNIFLHTSMIEQLKITIKNQEAVIHQRNNTDQMADPPSADCMKQLSDLITKKDQELEVSFVFASVKTLSCNKIKCM